MTSQDAANLAIDILRKRAARMTVQVNEYLGVRAPAHVRQIRRALRRYDDLARADGYSKEDLLYMADILRARSERLALPAKLLAHNPELATDDIRAAAVERERCLDGEKILRAWAMSPGKIV